VRRYLAEIGQRGGRSKIISAKRRRWNARRAALTRWGKAPRPKAEYRPIWEVARELVASIPEKELRKLPSDGARQLDHYLYGAPKKSR